MSKGRLKFYIAFAATVIILALLQRLFHFRIPALPEPVARAAEDGPSSLQGDESLPTMIVAVAEEDAQSLNDTTLGDATDVQPPVATSRRTRINRSGSRVQDYGRCFPDIQDVQIVAAEAHGITPVETQEDVTALVRSHRLVHIGGSPFYAVDDLTHSLPYLVPRAQDLLTQIGLNFLDSLAHKGVQQPYLPIVTSVLRTREQVSGLQAGNKNATTNSCHCYGTTLDIAYHRFVPLSGQSVREAVRRDDDELKFILAEVLYDLRQEGRCYVKYERKQACFHLTVR